jgi:hypothetical protein
VDVRLDINRPSHGRTLVRVLVGLREEESALGEIARAHRDPLGKRE